MAAVVVASGVSAAENSDLQRDIIEDEGIITNASHPDRVSLDLDYESRVLSRLMSMMGTLDEIDPYIVRQATTINGTPYEAGVQTSGAFGRSTARMTTLHDMNQATREYLTNAGFNVNDDGFRIGLSQYNFIRNEAIRYVGARSIWLEETPPNKQRGLSEEETFRAIQDVMDSQDLELKAKVDAYVKTNGEAIVRLLGERLFTQDHEQPGQIGEETAYHLAYSIAASDVADRKGDAAPSFANAFFDPVRNAFAPQLEELKRIAMTLDNAEVIQITEAGFGNDADDRFRIGANDQGLDPELVISENWALAAAAIADATTNLKILFPDREF